MNNIIERLQLIRAQKKTGLMTHIVIGYPSLEENIEVVQAMEEAGADFVELQMPFSDPVADGPTMMRANEASLAKGTTMHDCLELMRILSLRVKIPLLFMGYFNLVFNYGTEKFCRDARAANASGLIIPDMPLDEEDHEHLFRFCKKNDLINITFISPASTDERIHKIAQMSEGFIYCFSTYGVTGAREKLDPRLSTYIKRVKKFIDLPLGVGFGIKTHKHIEAVAKNADIAIVGSAILNRYDELPFDQKIEGLKHYIQTLLGVS